MDRFVLAIVLSLTATNALAQENVALPQGPGVNLVFAKCQECHPISYTTSNAGLPDFLWRDTLDLMKKLGMQVTEDEEETLYQYLTTYLGTDPPPSAAATTESKRGQLDGDEIYAESCAACHGPDGQGKSDSFPPLKGHLPELAVADHSYPPLVVLYGLSGEIQIEGRTFSGMMPPWGHLSNAQVAAVLNTVMNWSETQGTEKEEIEPYTPEDIEAARGHELNPPDVRGRRPELP